jgi:hypothetical protein
LIRALLATVAVNAVVPGMIPKLKRERRREAGGNISQGQDILLSNDQQPAPCPA